MSSEGEPRKLSGFFCGHCMLTFEGVDHCPVCDPRAGDPVGPGAYHRVKERRSVPESAGERVPWVGAAKPGGVKEGIKWVRYPKLDSLGDEDRAALEAGPPKSPYDPSKSGGDPGLVSRSPDTKLGKRFTYHAPHGDQTSRYEILRGCGHRLSLEMTGLCPQSRELDLALVRVQEAIMWANASIAINEADEGKA